jgi:chemotaxis protein methyltransferase CheR
VKPALKNLVQFDFHNLKAEFLPQGNDIIFCRNVMIYFDKPTQLAILERFAPLLHDDGLLFAGHSESFHNAAHLFRLRGKTVYSLVHGGGK